MSNLVLIIVCALAVLLTVPFVLLVFAALGKRHKRKKR